MGRSRDSRNHLLAWIAALGFIGRVLIPAGFMPAPVSEGWPVQFCPASPGSDWLVTAERIGNAHSEGGHATQEHSKHSPEGDSDGEHRSYDPCPLGAAFASTALIDHADLVVSTPQIADGQLSTTIESPVIAPVSAVLSRGPPAPLSIAG